MKIFQRIVSDDTKPRIELNCDEALRQMRGLGLWQLINFLLLCFPTMASGFLVLSFVFTGNHSQYINIK